MDRKGPPLQCESAYIGADSYAICRAALLSTRMVGFVLSNPVETARESRQLLSHAHDRLPEHMAHARQPCLTAFDRA